MKTYVKRPHISEKTLLLAAKGWYTFAVDTRGRKEDIRKEIETLYNVGVTKIRSIAMHGKVRRVGKKMKAVAKSDWKKIMVQLKPGQKIDAFEVTQEPQGEKSSKAGSPPGGK
jgi:large subunit ribosomal protein L23